MYDIKQASTLWTDEADKIQKNFKLIDKLLPKTLNYLGDKKLTRNSLNVSERFTGKIISYLINGVFLREQYIGTIFDNSEFGLDSNWQEFDLGGSGGSNYVHPATHPASMIVQSPSLRFVTDDLITLWNSKSNFSGSYTDLTNKPSLFDGNYNSLSNKPTFKTINGVSIIGSGDITINAGSGSGGETATSIGTLIYNSTNKSNIIDADFFAIRNSDDSNLNKFSYLNLKVALKAYFDSIYSTFNGNYNLLTNKPTLFDGNYNSLTNKPTLFDGNYNSLTNKPTIPTTLAQLSGDTTHRTITDTEKSNIPKNDSININFSNQNIELDLNYDIFVDNGFELNTSLTSGNKTITFINVKLNKVITLLLPKIDALTVLLLHAECKKIQGDYSTTNKNIVYIHCVSISPLLFTYTISQI